MEQYLLNEFLQNSLYLHETQPVLGIKYFEIEVEKGVRYSEGSEHGSRVNVIIVCIGALDTLWNAFQK